MLAVLVVRRPGWTGSAFLASSGCCGEGVRRARTSRDETERFRSCVRFRSALRK